MAQIFRKKGETCLLAALASGSTVREAAAQAGMTERTIYRRLTDPTFTRRIAELRSEMLDHTLGKLSAARALAADTLKTLLHAEAEGIRLQAARSLLEVGLKLRETQQLEARLAELEARMEAKDNTNNQPNHTHSMNGRRAAS